MSLKIFRPFVGIVAVLLAMSSIADSAEKAQPFSIRGLTAPPGAIVSGFLTVPGDESGITADIPVTVINGTKKGSVLGLVAGIHGFEYPPILATYRLKKMIDPESLSGTVVLVHIANIPSFRRRTIYYGPADGKNLNRVFPGDPKGTLSERIASVLTEDIIARCDVLIDMHCGDGNESLIPYAYWMISGAPALDDSTKKLAVAFGLPVIIIDKERTKDPRVSKYFGNTAILRGKPAITTEAGYLGRSDEESVLKNINGAMNIMRHLGMIAGPEERASVPLWIDRYEVVMSQRDGLFQPSAEMGHAVVKGQKIGVLTDLLGEAAEDIVAPWTGVLLYIIGTPPANKGEPLFEIGRIREEAE
jgi:predicted deacylase